MSFLSEKVRKSLESNPNVQSVTAKNVSYTPAFIESVLKKHEAGKSPREIWLEAGFDVSWFKEGYFKKAVLRWQKKAEACGVKSFGVESRGRRKGPQFASLEEEVAYLRAENAFLKELRALEESFAND